MKALKMFALAGLLMVILIFSSWASGQAEQNKETGPITLGFARWTRAAKAWEAYEDAFARFEEAHPGVKVDANQIPFKDYTDSVIRFAMSGSAPDVFVMYDATIGSFVSMGALYKMDDLFTPEYKEKFYESNWKLGTVRGHQYGVPFRNGPHVMFYNKTMFKDAGLPGDLIENGPDNYDQMLQAAQAVTQGGKYGFSSTWGDEEGMHMFRAFNVNAGSSLLNDDFDAVFNNATGLKVQQFLVDLDKKYGVVPAGGLQKTKSMGVEEFMNGMVSMITCNAAHDGKIRDVPFEYGIIEIPTPNDVKENAGTIGGFTVHSMAAQTKNPQLAWELVQELSSVKFIDAYCRAMNLVPTRKDVVASDSYWYTGKLKLFVDALAKSNSRCLPPHAKVVELAKIMKVALQSSVAGKLSVKDAFDDAAAEWNKIK